MIVLKVKDFSVSQEIFELHQHPQFEMLQTKPVPDSKSLPKYYQTEEYISHTDRKKTLLELGANNNHKKMLPKTPYFSYC